MALPNCLVIGAMRSGTSSLYQLLGQHPDVFMSTPKEPSYFAVPPGAAVEIESSPCVSERSAYEALFDGGRTHRVRGEASHSYLYLSDHAAPRLREALDDVRLIAILRNPIDRAFSHYLFHVRNGHESAPTFEDAIELEQGRIDAGEQFGHYLRRGFYARQLRPYLDLFESSDLRVCLFEDLERDPHGLMRDLYGFLGVDDRFLPDVSIRSNPSGLPRNRVIHAVLVRQNPIKRTLQPLLPRSAYRWAARVRDRNLERPKLEDEIRVELADVFRADVEELQGMIGRDLSGWL